MGFSGARVVCLKLFMNLLRFAVTLLLLSIPSFAQVIDYRALGTNAFFTNALIVNSKHWTNQTGSYIYQPVGRSVDITGANPGPPFFFHKNGSYYVGTNVTQDAFTLGNIQVPFIVSMTDSNEPTTVTADWWAIDSEAYNVYGGASLVVQQGGSSILRLISDNGAQDRTLSFTSQPGSGAIGYTSNSIAMFAVAESGDLAIIKTVTYSWPTGYGAETNYVLTDTNKAGSLSWQPGLLSPTGTNIIRSIATNAVSSTSIGPGTNNFLAKFTVGGTNVQNSALYSGDTNYVHQRQRADGGTYTNSATNLVYSIETANANTNSRLEFVAGNPFGSEVSHIRHASLFPSSRPPIIINDALQVEPLTDQLGGHGAGAVIPLTDGDGVNGQTLGTGVKSWHGVFADKWGFIADPNNDACIFTDATGGGHGFGISTSGALYLTGPGFAGIQYNQSGLLGAAQLDLGTSGLGAGATISNALVSLRYGGTAGLWGVGTNSSVAAPTSVGIISANASGTDKGSPDFISGAGASTGTGTNGNWRVQTSEKANSTSASVNTATRKDRIFVIGDPIILTTNSATIVANITIPTALRGVGGTVHAHTEIENGVDIATTDETFVFTANRKASTVVTGISAPITCTSSSGGSAAIANTWTAIANSTSVDLKLTCVTSGILSTNSTVRVTIIPNSSAVPVISHP